MFYLNNTPKTQKRPKMNIVHNEKVKPTQSIINTISVSMQFKRKVEPNTNTLFKMNIQSNTNINPLINNETKKNSIVLVSIFKNEGHILKEWIEHYIKEGVDTFCLIDNGSTDNYIEQIQKYINNGKVILNIDDTLYQQTQLYNKYYLEYCKTFDWVIVVDLDEFMYSRNRYKTIKNYLTSLDNSISRIEIPWKMYGSSGFINQPDSVIQNFIERQKYTNYDVKTDKSQEVSFNFIKCIVRGSKLIKLDIHNSFLNNDSTPNSTCKHKTENDLNKMNIHLNHYAIQSLDFFKNVKMIRGAADHLTSVHIRTLDYFKRYDHKDMIDEELKNKKY